LPLGKRPLGKYLTPKNMHKNTPLPLI